MENNLNNFLKNKLSVDELNIDSPDISLVNEAREKIKLRKQQLPERESFFNVLLHLFQFRLKPYRLGIASVLIIGSLFYFINTKTEKGGGALVSQNATTNYSISSSTVLASLTQYTNNKTATSSSTVLTSIITFVVRN
jgi:hypothetical protein